jgi:hypothetical protein
MVRPVKPQNRFGNKLLASLSDEDYIHILQYLEQTCFSFGESIYQSCELPNYAYFPTTSVVSLIYTMRDGASAEMVMVGNEGLIGIALYNTGKDRTLRTVFTHDHFGPSTHQQVGLYAGLVVEPTGSQWRDPETGVIFGTRFDGGPTSWRADILTSNHANSYREFLLEFADFQHAYRPNNTPVNPPAKEEVGLPFLLEPAPQCPGGVPRPCPEAISADDPGTMVVNYRNEPLALRVRNPFTNTQAAGDAGDLSMAFRSITRADPLLNVQPNFYPRLTKGVKPTDPFTPLMRFYENDKVQIRILVGAHEEGHNVSVHGTKWLFEPSDPNSGWRNSQMMGISEHFEFVLSPISVTDPSRAFADHLYMVGAATDDLRTSAAA